MSGVVFARGRVDECLFEESIAEGGDEVVEAPDVARCGISRGEVDKGEKECFPDSIVGIEDIVNFVGFDGDCDWVEFHWMMF